MPKGTSQAEVTSSSEKIKPVALAIIKLYLSEGISQSVTQSVGHSVTRKFHLIFKNNNPVATWKAFRVNLKACLGLVLRNQHCFIVVREK